MLECRPGEIGTEVLMAKESLGERICTNTGPHRSPSVSTTGLHPRRVSQRDCNKTWFQACYHFPGCASDLSRALEKVQRFATAWQGWGSRRVTFCALMLPNSIQFVVSFYACQLLGVTVTAINPTYKALEIQHQLKDSGAKVLIILDAVFVEARRGSRAPGLGQ